jgi:hypothetical protein
VLAFATIAIAPLPTTAGELAGVTMPDVVHSGDQTLELNGMGLRELIFLDIYVGGLYLPTRTTSAAVAINSDVRKRIVMHFVIRNVPKDRMVDSFRESLEANSGTEQFGERLDILYNAIEACQSNDTVTLDYVPRSGITLYKNNNPLATIPGADFMRAIWGIFIGENPPTEALRNGMLGL